MALRKQSEREDLHSFYLGVLMPGVSLGINLDDVTTGLVVGSGGTTSPAWATNVRTIVQAIIDDIEATIVPSEININANLEFNNNRAVEVAGVGLQNLTTQPTGGANANLLYEYNGELYFNDANNNAVRITLNGAVDITSTGQITGMSGSAAVTYTGGGTDEYAFVDHNGYPAGMDHGPIQLKEQAAAISNAVTLQSPTGLGSNYNWIYPTALPSSGTELVTVTNTGQLDTTANPSVTTITASGLASLDGGARFRATGNGNETLDTFEDIGTYTPTLFVDDVSQTPDTIEGNYCRIGSWVMVHIWCTSTGEDFGTGVYDFSLPYTAETSGSNVGIWTGSVGHCIVGATEYPDAAAIIADPEDRVQLKPDIGDATATDIASGGTGITRISVFICYLTDAAAD